MNSNHLENIDFGFIRYSNCWEDVEILLESFDIDSNSKIISIASGGDNCFSLAAQRPEYLIAADFSQVQLFLVELKMAGIKNFDRETYMKFTGFLDSNDRKEMFIKIKPDLSVSAQKYWTININQIESGIIDSGKFEHYFQLFKKELLDEIHPKELIEELFEKKSGEEQEKFYNEYWFDERWESRHSFFFGKEMLGEKGRDPEFMKQIKGSVSKVILEREIAHVKSTYCQDNQFLFYILNNRFDETHLPHYVRSENYDLVKENLDKITLKQGLIGKVAKQQSDGTHFNLSNIFEYMDNDHFRYVSEVILDNCNHGAKLGYWNFLVDRNIATIFNDRVTYDPNLCNTLSLKDKGYFYSRFILNTVK